MAHQPDMRDELVVAVRAHAASEDPTSVAALRELRALEAAMPDFHGDPEATAAAAHLHRARMSALPEDAQATDLVATVVLFSFVLATAPARVPPEVRELLQRKPPPPPALGLTEWASLALEDALAARDRDGVDHALMLAERAGDADGAAAARLGLLELRARGHHALYQWADDLDSLDEAIELWREYAAAVGPGEPAYASAWSNLGVALDNRGTRRGRDEDLTEAIEYAQRAVAHAAEPERRARFLSNLASALNARSTPEDRKAAIEASREAVALTAADDPARPIRLTNLGNALGGRYMQTGETALLKESIAVFREAVALTRPDDPALEGRKANLATALAAAPGPDPRPRRSLTRALRKRVARSELWSRCRTRLYRIAHRIDVLEYRFSSYRRTRPVPNLLQGMHEHVIGGPVAGARAAAALPPPLVGLEDIGRCAGEWVRRQALWTAAGVGVLTFALNAADLSWGASAIALAIAIGIDRLLVGRGRSLSYALRFCPVGATLFMALAGAAFAGLAALACAVSGVRPPAAALAAAWGWAWTTTAIIKPAIAAELAFSRGERRRVQSPAAAAPGGVSMLRVRKDRILPIGVGPFDDEHEALLLDGWGPGDSGPRRVEALRYARRELPRALAVAALVAAAVAVITAVFLVLASRLSLGVAILCAVGAGLLVATEKLRMLVEEELHARDVADDRAPRPSVSLSPGVATRFAQFAGGGPVGDLFVAPGNHPEAAAGAPRPRAGDDAEEVWE